MRENDARIGKRPPERTLCKSDFCPAGFCLAEGNLSRNYSLGGLAKKLLSKGPAVSIVIGFPQCGQSPEVMPAAAATGIPQLGQVP